MPIRYNEEKSGWEAYDLTATECKYIQEIGVDNLARNFATGVVAEAMRRNSEMQEALEEVEVRGAPN